MTYLSDYIRLYGDYDFVEKPFNDIDNLILSQLIYADFEGIVDYNNCVQLAEAAKKYYELHSATEIEGLIKISNKAVKLLKECAKTKRYADAVMCRYVNNVNDEIDKQFSAINFILNDNSLAVAFRGTDVTVTGVKESVMLSYMFPVPAQIEALHYFQETAMCHDGDVRACGHSKGGNLAVFAAVSCSNSLKKKIVGVYENDAPGFPKWFFERYDYQQIKDKIRVITPESSIIGRMLYHDKAPVIVESDNSGLRQHQVSSWKIDGDKLVEVKEYDSSSNYISDYVNNLILYMKDDELELLFNTVEYLFDTIGINNFYDLKKFDLKHAFSLIDSHSALDNQQKEKVKQIIRKTVNDFTKQYLSNISKSFFAKNKDNKGN